VAGEKRVEEDAGAEARLLARGLPAIEVNPGRMPLSAGEGEEEAKMPCFETRETTVALEAADLDALAAALEGQGHHVHSRQGRTLTGVDVTGRPWRYADGTLVADQGSALARDVNATKRAYSREVVRASAKRAGWQARFQGDTFTLTKRRF
jgi:hypothetical protein